MGGVKPIDMRAQGTQKTKTEATCSHTTKTQAHGQQTNHQPCAKQDTNMQLMRKLISHVFTQDMTTLNHADNEKHKLHATQHKTKHECMQPIKTRTACNTTKHTWTEEHVSLCEHTHTMRQNVERECPNPDTKPKLKTWLPGSEHHAPTWNKARRRESARLEHARSRMLTWKQNMIGVSGLCHKTMKNTRPRWQNSDIVTKLMCDQSLLCSPRLHLFNTYNKKLISSYF